MRHGWYAEQRPTRFVGNRVQTWVWDPARGVFVLVSWFCPQTRKRAFALESLAQERLQQILESVERTVVVPSRVYFCEECGGWELTGMRTETER